MIAGGNLPADRTPVSGDVSNLRHVSFQRTPNLYFVSFESAAPRSLLRKYLGLETSRFNDLIEGEMRRFSNLFADNIATAHALNTVLSLEVDVYHSQRETLEREGRNPDPYLFSGQNPSPLLDILRRNGYETTSVYLNSYLGKRKGPYIDNYLRFSKVTVCDNLDPGLQNISFWGYCHWFESARRKGKRVNSRKWMVGEIEKASANDGPQFVMAHLPSPIHTDRFFNYGNEEHRDRFRKLYVGGDNAARYLLDRLIRHLEENDPEAILLVYGDHGPHLSRHAAFGKDMTFRVQDMYGVAGAVWPRDACAVELDEASAKGWMTVLDAVHAILRCLSGGESALVGPRKYVPRYGPIPSGFDFDYEEFLYE